MFIKIGYFSLLFIFSLVSISRENVYQMKVGERIRSKEYSLLTWVYFLWCVLVIIGGSVSSGSDIVKHIFFYLSDFARMGSFVLMIEVCGYLTDFKKDNEKFLIFVTELFLYIGMFIELYSLIVLDANVSEGRFGIYFYIESKLLILIHTAYDFAILFMMYLLIIRYYEKCKKDREIYAFKLYIFVATIMMIGFLVENIIAMVSCIYIPTVSIASGITIIAMERCLIYKRSIQYLPEDYAEVLAPTYEKPVVITNDEGRILFSNKRAQVFAEGFRDIFNGRDICGVFSLDECDRDKLYSREKTKAKFTCKYKKNNVPVTLYCNNVLDRYKKVFVSIITITTADAETIDTENVLASVTPSAEKFKASISDVDEIKINELIRMISHGLKLYENNQWDVFFMNLRGIQKSSNKLGYSALYELTKRIQAEEKNGNADSISSMVIEMDRQGESIKALRESTLN